MGIRTSFPEQKAGFGARSQPPLSISEELQETVQIKQAKAYCLLTANPEDRISMRLPDCFHFMSCSSIRKKKKLKEMFCLKNKVLDKVIIINPSTIPKTFKSI